MCIRDSRRTIPGVGAVQTRCALAPVEVLGIDDAVELVVGTSHACARRAGGSVVCWGSNGEGELGDGTRSAAAAPVAVRDVRGAIALAAAARQSCALVRDGTLRCWGGDVAVPIVVPGVSGIASIAGGGAEICAVSATGDAGCTTVSPSMGPPALLASGVASIFRDGFVDLALPPTVPPIGGEITCMRTTTGAVSCLGDNDGGQLADGTTTARTTLAAWRLR